MSKPIASSASFTGSFIALAAAIVGATALSLATPLPAAADERGRWEHNDKKGKQNDGQGRRQNPGNGNRNNGWNRNDGNRNNWQGGGNHSHGGNQWNGGRNNWSGGGRNNWNGGGGHGHGGGNQHGDWDDHRHGNGHGHYYKYKGPKVYNNYYYSQPVYVPAPAPVYAYTPGYFCNPCAHWFATYDDLYQHVAYAHYVPDYDVPNVVVQVGVNWVFGF